MKLLNRVFIFFTVCVLFFGHAALLADAPPEGVPAQNTDAPPEGVQVPAQNEYHLINWRFAAYERPDFTSRRVASFDPGLVRVVSRFEGWALIDTEYGGLWVFLPANLRYVDRNAALFVYQTDTRADSFIAPQVVSIVFETEDWLLIDTWQGPRWMRQPRVIPPGARLVALTFDDGPSRHTPRLLDALYERGVSATFFTTGKFVNINPQTAARIVAEGHEIGCHAFSHQLLTGLSADAIRRELANSSNAIYNATGTRPTLFRPPYGGHNATIRRISAELYMPLIFWSVDTNDWRYNNAQTILRNVFDSRGNPRVQEGDIILMHDITASSVDAAILIIERLQEHGFHFVTVSQLFEAQGIMLEPGVVYRNARN